MQAIIEAAKLARATKLVNRAKVGGAYDCTNWTKVTINGAIELDATNLTTWAKVRLPGLIEHDGGLDEVVVDSRLTDFVKAATGEIILETASGGLKVNGATIPTLPLDDYPTFPELTDRAPLLTLSGKEAKALIKRFGIIPIRGNTTRLNLTGIYFRWANGRLTIAATDGYRLLREEHPGPDGEGEIIVPASELKRFGPQIPAKAEATFGVATWNDLQFLTLSFDGAEITIKAIPEEYPDIDRVTPRDKWPEAVELELPVAEFLAVLKRAAPFTDCESDAIQLDLEPDGVIVSANARGEFLETVGGQCRFPIDQAGEEYNPAPAIKFRRRYLEEYLTNCIAETVKITLTGPEKAGRFESEGAGVYVCMPVRMNV